MKRKGEKNGKLLPGTFHFILEDTVNERKCPTHNMDERPQRHDRDRIDARHDESIR
jgi:hypothetical protein